MGKGIHIFSILGNFIRISCNLELLSSWKYLNSICRISIQYLHSVSTMTSVLILPLGQKACNAGIFLRCLAISSSVILHPGLKVWFFHSELSCDTFCQCELTCCTDIARSSVFKYEKISSNSTSGKSVKHFPEAIAGERTDPQSPN